MYSFDTADAPDMMNGPYFSSGNESLYNAATFMSEERSLLTIIFDVTVILLVPVFLVDNYFGSSLDHRFFLLFIEISVLTKTSDDSDIIKLQLRSWLDNRRHGLDRLGRRFPRSFEQLTYSTFD